jgi:dihydroorotase
MSPNTLNNKQNTQKFCKSVLQWQFCNMYDITLQGVEVCDPQSSWHGQTIDLHLTPASISQGLSGKIFDARGLKVSPGWVDMRSAMAETLKDSPTHLAHSAAAGGFTHLGIYSNPELELNKPELISNLLNTSFFGVSFLPMPDLSTHGELNELGLLSESGAKAFSAGQEPLQNTRLIAKSLLYSKMFDSPVCSLCLDTQIAPDGQMHEGMVSVALGMPAIPELAEELALLKFVSLLSYTGGKLHLHGISTQKGFELIEQAKNNGLKITCDAAVNHFYFRDRNLAGFDTNLKVFPPFRSDNQALWRAVRNGVLDAICSDHCPQDLESKRLEFDLAAFGALALETFFGVLVSTKPEDIELATLLELFSRKPREILKLSQPKVEQGQVPDLTLFDENFDWLVQAKDLKSKSQNSPFLNRNLKGKAMGIFTRRGFYLDDEMQKRAL